MKNGRGNLLEYKFGSILTLKCLKNFFFPPILIIFGYVVHQACTNDLYFDDFFLRNQFARKSQKKSPKFKFENQAPNFYFWTKPFHFFLSQKSPNT